jgi:hypothetical protein
MNVSYSCPNCEATQTIAWTADAAALACPACATRIEAAADAFEDGRLSRCLACACTDVYVRKDFPQRWGVTIAVVGFAASLVAWNAYWIYTTFGVLFATALADLALYHLVGNVLVCYRCGAQYRNLEGMEDQQAFRLETHERYRQQAARLANSPRPAGQDLAPR